MGIIQINGKKPQQIAKEYGVSPARVRQYAKQHDLPYITFDGGATVEFYVFDEEAEKAFASRNTKTTGRPAAPKQPKEPGKPGRPRKDKPVAAGPKRPVGRPRKGPAVEAGPKRPVGRPRKQTP